MRIFNSFEEFQMFPENWKLTIHLDNNPGNVIPNTQTFRKKEKKKMPKESKNNSNFNILASALC